MEKKGKTLVAQALFLAGLASSWCLGAAAANPEPKSYMVPAGLWTDYPKAAGMVAADFNGDGRVDFAVMNDDSRQGNEIVIWHGNASGGYTRQLRALKARDAYSWTLGVSDFNRDGYPDLYFLGRDASLSRITVVLPNDGRGGFPLQKTLTVGTGDILTLDVRDINGDSSPDLLLGHYDGNRVEVYLNDGHGNVGAAISSPTGSQIPNQYRPQQGYAYADFNGDGHLDRVATRFATYGYAVALDMYPGNGHGAFGAAVTTPISGPNQADATIRAADFNGDGKIDLLMSRKGNVQQPGGIFILPGDGKGHFGAAGLGQALANDALVVGTCDCNGDAVLDLVTARKTQTITKLGSIAFPHVRESIAILPGNGHGGFGAPQAYGEMVGELSGFAAIDRNGDGRQDLFLTGQTAGVNLYGEILGYDQPDYVTTIDGR